jgi:mutual gliding-motility protein MglA
MVQFDNQYRQIKIKIVYYGPALGGKTTCLQQIHRATDPERRTKLYSLNTASDRTLFFDLLSLNLGRIRGYRLAMQLYTVPGQVQYNATRRAVLSGADGVVFVADSQVEQADANLQSIENLSENLAANGLDRETIPLVLQYNKRDLRPVLEVEDMDRVLNRRHVPAFPTVAISGVGILEAFTAISEKTLASVADKLGVGTNTAAVERLVGQVKVALAPLLKAEAEGSEPGGDDVEVLQPEVEGASAAMPLSEEALVGEAVRANMAMTDLNAQLDATRRQLERKLRVLAGITDFGRAVSGASDPADVLRHLLKATVSLLQLQAAAVLFVPGSGEMREAVTHGLRHDPLLHTPDEAGEPLAVSIVNQREPCLVARDLEGEGSYLIAALESSGYASGVAVPMIAQDRIVGLLTGYGDRERTALDPDDLQLASVLAATAAVGYTSAVAWRRLEELNRGLEEQVAERTGELRSSLEEVQRLADDLTEKNRLLEDAYRDLSELDRVKNELITRISHELKTPVTSLLTAAKILDRYRDAPAEKGARFVSIIKDEAEKLSEIIQSVFQASILATAEGPPERQTVPVEELIKKAVAPLRELAKQREVSLQVLIPSGLDAVSCEAETMEAALRAVIKNAIEFNHAGGEVSVEIRRVLKGSEPWLQLKVRDTGVGIPEHEKPYVFDAFWQGGNVLTGKPRGIGLGLAIAKRVVENHGGTIALTSLIGEGSEVVLALPQSGAAGAS